MITTRYGLTTAVLTCSAALLAGPQAYAASIDEPSIELGVDFLDPTTGSELAAVVPGQRVTVSVEVDNSTNGLAMFSVEINNDDSGNFTFEPFFNNDGVEPFPDNPPHDDNDFNNAKSSGFGTFPSADGPRTSGFGARKRVLSTSTSVNLPGLGLRLNEAIPKTIPETQKDKFKDTVDLTADENGEIGKGQTEILNFDIFVNDDATIGSTLKLKLLAKDEFYDTNALVPDNPPDSISGLIGDKVWSRLTENLSTDPNPAIASLPEEPEPFSFVYAEVDDFDISLFAYETVSTTGNSISVVPSPTAALSGLMLLGGLALRRRRRVA